MSEPSTDTRRVALAVNTRLCVGPPIARELARRGHDLVIGDPETGLVVAARCSTPTGGT